MSLFLEMKVMVLTKMRMGEFRQLFSIYKMLGFTISL